MSDFLTVALLEKMIKPYTRPATYVGDLYIKDNYDYAMELTECTTVEQWNETINKITSIPMRATIEASGIIHQIILS